MATDLPPTPAPINPAASLQAGIDPGTDTDLSDPFPALLLERFTQIEGTRQVVDQVRGLLNGGLPGSALAEAAQVSLRRADAAATGAQLDELAQTLAAVASAGTGGIAADGGITTVKLGTSAVTAPKIAPGAVGLGKLDQPLASRVKVPEFVPQDQTTLLGLPTAYVRSTSPEITRADVGLRNIYWPYLVRVPAAVQAAFPQYGKWRLYCSTDHDPGAGGVACLMTDAERPGDPGAVWTPIRPSGVAIIFKAGSTQQIETPTVVYNEATALFHMYYQAQGVVNGEFAQFTQVATSANGITGWTVVPGAGIPNPVLDFQGHGHTGYARVYLVDGQWVAWHLGGGGGEGAGPQAAYGWSYSNDGFSWVTDKRRVLTAASWGGPLFRLGVSTLIRYRGQLWGFGLVVTYASGKNSEDAASRRAWCAPMRDDLLGPVGKIQDLPFVFDAGVPNQRGLGANVAAAADGSLWSAYRTGDALSSFRFMEVK